MPEMRGGSSPRAFIAGTESTISCTSANYPRTAIAVTLLTNNGNERVISLHEAFHDRDVSLKPGQILPFELVARNRAGVLDSQCNG